MLQVEDDVWGPLLPPCEFPPGIESLFPLVDPSRLP